MKYIVDEKNFEAAEKKLNLQELDVSDTIGT